MQSKTVKLIVRLLIGSAVVAGVWWVVHCRCVSLSALTPAAIRDFIRGFGRLAAVVYVFAYALNTVSVVPPIAPLSLAAGLAFGSRQGALLLMTAALLGTSVTFAISRFFARALVERLVKGRFRQLDEKLRRNGFMTVLFFRVIPLVPYEILNYACGLSRISFKDYFLATFLGLIPGVVVAAFFGGSLGEIKGVRDIFAPRFLMAAGLMVLIIAVPAIYQAVKKKRQIPGVSDTVRRGD